MCPPRELPPEPINRPIDPRVVRTVLEFYRRGWFPMHDNESKTTRWVQPRARAVIPLDPDLFKVSRSLRARIRANTFTLRTDTAFDRVIRECAAPASGREDTWLATDIIDLFTNLHRAGHAHSVEAWIIDDTGERLVGGLYGLALGKVFCGESMFSRPTLGGTDASKVCLVHLVHHLRRRGFQLLDAQLHNDHLAQFGMFEMDARDYLAQTRELATDHVDWLPFEPGRTHDELVAPRP